MPGRNAKEEAEEVESLSGFNSLLRRKIPTVEVDFVVGKGMKQPRITRLSDIY